MNRLLIISILSAALMTSCGHSGPDGQGSSREAEARDHGTELHDHESEGHDHASENHTGHDHEEKEHDHAGEIAFTKEQAARTDFELLTVEPAPFRDVIETSGRILAAQGDEAAVAAPVSGIVSFADKKLSDGAAVSRGETLFTISSKGIAEGDYEQRIRSAYTQAETAFRRAEKLIGDRIITQTEYEQARLAYENAKTAYDALASKSSAKGTRATAPIGGFVKSLSVGEGDYVTVGQSLATVSQNRKLVLRAEVSQKYAGRLRAVTSANFETPYDGRVYSLAEMGGRLLSVGKGSDGTSAYIPVTFEFDNGGEVIPGSFVEVFLLSAPRPETLAVPLSAVTEDQGVYSVFVQLDPETYVKREVKLGASDGTRVQILEGLSPGETIVSRGVAQVKMASFSGAIPGHTHSH